LREEAGGHPDPAIEIVRLIAHASNLSLNTESDSLPTGFCADFSTACHPSCLAQGGDPFQRGLNSGSAMGTQPHRLGMKEMLAAGAQFSARVGGQVQTY